MNKHLFTACSNGNVEEVRQLLQHPQVDPNCQDTSPWKRTPFYIACSKGYFLIVKLLLADQRVDVNKSDSYGETPFSIACFNGKIEIVKLLLGDKRVDINLANKDGATPLYVACSRGQIGKGLIDVVKVLLNDQRVSIRKKTNEGKTAMDVAKERNHCEVNSKVNMMKVIQEFDTEQRYREYLETFQSFVRLENETINKQDFLILNEYLKKNKNIKELKFTNCDLTPSIFLEILKTLIWKYENGQLSNIQDIEVDDIKLESTEGLEIIPIEIRTQGTKAIVKHLLDLCKSPNSNPLYRTKLMVVGYENVGKTAVLDCLFPLRDFGEIKGIFQKNEYLIELQGLHLRKYKPNELDKVHKEIILENRQWILQEIKGTGLELIPLKDKNQKKIEIYFKDQEIRDKWFERLKRVILNAATHGIEIQDQILQHQKKSNTVSELIKSLHSSSELVSLTPPSINVSIWDFSGQHDYYNNHHYFLSTRTVFLVLWKMKDGKNGLDGLNFWFKSLSSHLQHDSTSLANNKPYFSIIVVGTFLDDQSVDKSERSKKCREQEILEIARSNGIYYPIQIFEVSCSTMQNIDELKQSIYKTALTHGYMGEKLPIGYLNIKNSIEELRENCKERDIPIAKIEKLVNYCKSNSTFKFDDEFMKRALKLLHLWGTCVYFDEPKELSNYVILKPEFLTKEVMGKLFKPNLRNTFKDGILNHSDLKLFWPNYLEKAEMLMTLMEKFEVCFRLKENKRKPFEDQRSLIVSYLPEDKPNELLTYWPNEISDQNLETKRIILFNMIPKEMVSRLFVCLHQNIEDQLVWRYGMFLISTKDKYIRALVTIETEAIDQNGIDQKGNNQKGIEHRSLSNSQKQIAELKSCDKFKIKNQMIIKVRGEDSRDRKELMDNIVEEIWKCSKKYSGVVCYQMASSTFDSNPSSLIQLSDCLLETTKPKEEQGILCPTTQKVINPVDLLLKSGMIYQSEVIEEKKKEMQVAIIKVKNENNLNEDQTQQLLNNPQLTSILMSEILENQNPHLQDQKIQPYIRGNNDRIEEFNHMVNQLPNNPCKKIGFETSSDDISIKIIRKLDQLLQGQDLTNHIFDSAGEAIIRATQQQKDHEYPSYYLLLPLIKEQSKPSTSTIQRIFQKVKEGVENLIFSKFQLHCFCEFKVRSPKNGQLQPLFHPTNSPGIEIKELTNSMKKMGPTLKVVSIILQMFSVSADLAGIPLPDIGGAINQVVEYSEQIQKKFGNCEMMIENFRGLSNQEIMEKIKENGTSMLKLQPLEGDIIGTFKKEDMFGQAHNGYLEKVGLRQISILFDNEYGDAGDVLWVCQKHYDFLKQINNNRPKELKNKMVEIFSSSWSVTPYPNISNDPLLKNGSFPFIEDRRTSSSSQDNRRDSSNSQDSRRTSSSSQDTRKDSSNSQDSRRDSSILQDNRRDSWTSQDNRRDSSSLPIQSGGKTFILNHQGSKYKIKNCSTLEEIKGNIRMQLELTLQVIIKIKYLDNDGEYYVASDFDDLKDATKLEISLEFKKSDQDLKTSPGFKF